MKKLDFHVHINSRITEDQTVEYFTDMMKRHSYCGVGMMSLMYGGSHDDDPDCNARALRLRERLPGSVAFGSVSYDKPLGDQPRELMAQGFDGIKLLDGKPSVYRRFGLFVDGEEFDPFFAYCEKEQIPVLLHNNDPARNWDLSQADERAIKNGWVYDETVPPQSRFYESVERLMARHPDLRIALAHLGFYSDKLDVAARLLDDHPNMFLDITPALIIYKELSENPDAPEFFNKYSDRLIYGTDADNGLFGFAREYNDKKVGVITAFLEKGDAEVEGVKIRSLDLPRKKLEDIYFNNAMRFMKK